MTAESIEGRRATARIVRLAIAGSIALALTLALAATGADEARAALKFKQPACGKFKKQVRKATGSKKRAAKAKLKQCQADATVYKQVRNSRFVGHRADYLKIDTLYCGNGKWQRDVANGGMHGTSGWRIINAKVRQGGTRFTAVVEAWIPGGRYVQGLIRNGNAWQVGYEFGGKIHSPGAVEKTDGRAACRTL